MTWLGWGIMGIWLKFVISAAGAIAWTRNEIKLRSRQRRFLKVFWAQVAGEKDCTKPRLQAQARHFLCDMKIPGWKVGCGEGLFGLFGYSCSHVQLIFVARGLHLQQLAEGYWRLWPRCTMLQIKPWNCSKKNMHIAEMWFHSPWHWTPSQATTPISRCSSIAHHLLDFRWSKQGWGR